MNQSRVTAQLENIRTAPRCSAKTRAGRACQCPAFAIVKRCRLHGGIVQARQKGTVTATTGTGHLRLRPLRKRQWLKSMVRTCKGTEKVTRSTGDQVIRPHCCEAALGFT